MNPPASSASSVVWSVGAMILEETALIRPLGLMGRMIHKSHRSHWSQDGQSLFWFIIAARGPVVAVAAWAAVIAVAAWATVIAARATIAVAVAALAWRRRSINGLARRFPDQHFARQFYAILIVDGNHFHLQGVAHLANFLDFADVLVVQLADVAQAVAARQDLDERAEVLDRSDAAFVDLADPHLFGDGLDAELGGLGAGGLAVGDEDRAVLL